jgi:quinol monooxygenase YgiN
MSISFIAALVGTVAAAVGAGLLVRVCLRMPRMDMIAWIVALAGLAIGLAAQAAGYQRGFGPTTFRAVQLGAAVIAPLGLAWGMAEVAAKGLVARFAARLSLGGLFVVAAVILATDVLSSQPFSKAWPAARSHFEYIPLGLLALIAAVTLVTAVVSLAVVGGRTRSDPGWRAALPALGAAGLAALLTQGLQVKLPVNSAYAGLSVLAVAAAWLAGDRASRLSLTALRGGSRGSPHGYTGDDSLDLYGDGYRGYSGPGDFGGYPENGYGRYADTGGFHSGGYDAADTGGFGQDGYGGPGDFDEYGAPGYDSRNGDGADVPVTGTFDALYRDSGSGHRSPEAPASAVAAEPGGPGGPGIEFATGMQLPALDDAALAAVGDPVLDTERLYGQIAIYTLLEAGAAEFDRLAAQVLEQVRTVEPDTLVYVVHGVPSALLQRILYQVYRDRAAYDEHLRQPYVVDFDARLRPLVLATNVIELGVRQAKVSSLTPRRGRVP